MVEKIENSEVMTVVEFRNKYSDKWFYYMVVEKEEDCTYAPSSDNLKSEVLYIGDSEECLIPVLQESRVLYKEFHHFGITYGTNINPEPGIIIGGLEVEFKEF